MRAPLSGRATVMKPFADVRDVGRGAEVVCDAATVGVGADVRVCVGDGLTLPPHDDAMTIARSATTLARGNLSSRRAHAEHAPATADAVRLRGLLHRGHHAGREAHRRD